MQPAARCPAVLGTLTVMLDVKLRAWDILAEGSSTELYPQHTADILNVFLRLSKAL